MSWSSMALLRFTRCSLSLAVLALLMAGSPSGAQSLLDRVQGLYYPPNAGSWDCATLGMEGGAVGVQGTTLHGVENACDLTDAFPIPGMDAMMFDLTCAAEGTTYDGGKVILVPASDGLGLVWDGFVTFWQRCP